MLIWIFKIGFQYAKSLCILHINNEFIPAGVMETQEEKRYGYSTFQYGKKYLARPDAVAIDPITLPLSEILYNTPDWLILFGSIRDSAPDSWGRYVLDKETENVLSEFDYLVAASQDRIGALGFWPDPVNGPIRMSAPSKIQPNLNLDELVVAAQAYIDNSEEIHEYLLPFVEYGSSFGGARPKALAKYKGTSWVAKTKKAGLNINQAFSCLYRSYIDRFFSGPVPDWGSDFWKLGKGFVQLLIPLIHFRFHLFHECPHISLDGDFFNDVTLGNAVDNHLVIFRFNRTKNRVHTIQMGGGAMGDEKLAAVSAGSCIGHGKDSGFVMFQVFLKLIFKLIARSAHAVSIGTSALDHEVSDYPVEFQAVIIFSLGQVYKIPAGGGGEVCK